MKEFSFKQISGKVRSLWNISRANDQCVISIVSSREKERERDGLFLSYVDTYKSEYFVSNICFQIIVTAFSRSRRTLEQLLL